MLTEYELKQKMAEKPDLSAVQFFNSLNESVQAYIIPKLLDSQTPVTELLRIYKDYGFERSETAIRYFFYHLHDIEPENNRVKRQPMKVDIFSETMTAEQKCTLLEMVHDSMNPSIESILSYLKDLGYDGSWVSVRNWYLRTKKEGEHASRINATLSSYKGIDYKGVLYKLLGDTIRQLDSMSTILADSEDSDVTPGLVLKTLPAMAREVRACIDVLSKTENVSNALQLEKSGAMYVVEKLLETFKDNPQIHTPLKLACDGIMIEITSRQSDKTL